MTRAYGTYADMLSDPAVDLVYIATPHALHCEQMLQCVDAGKAVLCEKSFTANAAQAREALSAAEKKGVLVTEAIWTRYMPYRQMLNDLIAADEIGEVRYLEANLGYEILRNERIYTPALAGGALLDVGVYPINFASMVLGPEVTDIRSTVRMMSTGVDLEESMHLTWASGASAVLTATAACRTNRLGTVYGTKGWLQVDNINNPHELRQFDRNDHLLRTIPVPPQITGYEYQVRSALKAKAEGRVECPEMPHAETVRVMALMDTLRAQWHMVYPFE